MSNLQTERNRIIQELIRIAEKPEHVKFLIELSTDVSIDYIKRNEQLKEQVMILKNERDLKLLRILEELSDSLDLARTQPMSASAMQRVNQERLALAAWAKAEVRAGQTGEATWFIDPLPYKFDRLKAQAWPLMDAYNQAAFKYNEAIHQFPASLLAKQVKFLPAQMLDNADLLA